MNIGAILDLEERFKELQSTGATLLRDLVPEHTRRRLLEEIDTHPFMPVPERLGTRGGGVRQNFTRVDAFPKGSFVWEFGRIVETLFANTFGNRFDPDCPLAFTEAVAQKYDAIPVAIEPHKDHRYYRNFIPVFVLDGDGDLVVYDEDERPCCTFRARPGDCIGLAAPGLFGGSLQPLHSLGPIRTPRVSLTYRQRPRRS